MSVLNMVTDIIRIKMKRLKDEMPKVNIYLFGETIKYNKLPKYTPINVLIEFVDVDSYEMKATARTIYNVVTKTSLFRRLKRLGYHPYFIAVKEGEAYESTDMFQKNVYSLIQDLLQAPRVKIYPVQ